VRCATSPGPSPGLAAGNKPLFSNPLHTVDSLHCGEVLGNEGSELSEGVSDVREVTGQSAYPEYRAPVQAAVNGIHHPANACSHYLTFPYVAFRLLSSYTPLGCSMMLRVFKNICLATLILLPLLSINLSGQTMAGEWDPEGAFESSVFRVQIDDELLWNPDISAREVAYFLDIEYSDTLVTPWEAAIAAQAYFEALPEFQHHSEGCATCGVAHAVIMNNQLLSYVFELTSMRVTTPDEEPEGPPGFLSLSASKNIQPLIAYSGSSHFPWDVDQNNVLLNVLIDDLDNRMQADINGAGDLTRFDLNQSVWENLVGERNSIIGIPVYYASLFQGSGGTAQPFADRLIQKPAIWVQDEAPFNNLSPSCSPPLGVKSSRSRCQVGCVSLALAQILYYYHYQDGLPDPVRFPLPGIPDLTFDSFEPNAPLVLVKNNEDMSVWENWISDEGFNTTASILADTVAKLCRATGESVYTDYGWKTSYASMTQLMTALCETWGFTAELLMYDGSPTAFFGRLQENYTQERPFMLRIEGAGVDSHLVICDGVRERDGGSAIDFHLRTGFMTDDDKNACLECLETWEETWEGETWYALPSSDYPPKYNSVASAVIDIEYGAGLPRSRTNATASINGVKQVGASGGESTDPPYRVDVTMTGPADVRFAHFYWWPIIRMEKTAGSFVIQQAGIATRTIYNASIEEEGLHTFAAIIEQNGRTEAVASQVPYSPSLAQLTSITPTRGSEATYSVDDILTVDYFISEAAGAVTHIGILTLEPTPRLDQLVWVQDLRSRGSNVTVGKIEGNTPGERLVVLVAETAVGVLTAHATFNVK
jgi:Peptidase C10 family